MNADMENIKAQYKHMMMQRAAYEIVKRYQANRAWAKAQIKKLDDQIVNLLASLPTKKQLEVVNA